MRPLRIGTRGSRLALWQAHYVADRLRAAGRDVELVEVVTTGDRAAESPLAAIGGTGVFTKEIQRALRAGDVDVAVHSLKDLPTDPVEGLVLAAVPPRGAAGDVLVAPAYREVGALPPGATVATGSLRRRAQVLYRRPELRPVDVRGNVETRLRKLTEQGFDALILAEAGLERLGLGHLITQRLGADWMLPAVGQGALGLECRAEDGATRSLLAALDHEPSQQAVRAERAFLRRLGGGCLVPVGAATTVCGGRLSLKGGVFHPEGKRCLAGEVDGPGARAAELGERLADELLAQGAAELLAPGVGAPTDALGANDWGAAVFKNSEGRTGGAA
jgi:hydroxymethylbilane synthase